MTTPLARQLLTLAVVGLFAILGAATSGTDDGSGSGSAAASSTSAALSSIESNMRAGQIYADGPDAQIIADSVRQIVEPGDWIGVRVVPGNPRRVVVLIRFADEDVEGLRDMSDGERRETLDAILASIDDDYMAGADELGIGIRGSIFFGAIVIRRPGQPATYDTSRVASTEGLAQLLSAPAGNDEHPPIAVGQTIEGTTQPLPAHPLRYQLTLTERTLVRVRLRSALENGPSFTLCGDWRRAPSCIDHEMSDAWDDREWSEGEVEDGETPYMLAPGTYTLMVMPAYCDSMDDQSRCDAARASFTLSLR